MSRRSFDDLIEKSSNLMDGQCLKVVIPKGSLGFLGRHILEMRIENSGCEIISKSHSFFSDIYYVTKSSSELPTGLLNYLKNKNA